MKKFYYNRFDNYVVINNKEFDKLMTYIHNLEVSKKELKIEIDRLTNYSKDLRNINISLQRYIDKFRGYDNE